VLQQLTDGDLVAVVAVAVDHAGQPVPDGVVQRQPVLRHQLQHHDRDERLGVAAIRKNPLALTGVRLSRLATPLVPCSCRSRGAHLGQHPRYSGCGDRVEVTLQILLQVGMLSRCPWLHWRRQRRR
jgi:hypothetical protein